LPNSTVFTWAKRGEVKPTSNPAMISREMVLMLGMAGGFYYLYLLAYKITEKAYVDC